MESNAGGGIELAEWFGFRVLKSAGVSGVCTLGFSLMGNQKAKAGNHFEFHHGRTKNREVRLSKCPISSWSIL